MSLKHVNQKLYRDDFVTQVMHIGSSKKMKCYNFIALNNNKAIGANHHRTGNNRTEESPDHKTKGNSTSSGETKISFNKSIS